MKRLPRWSALAFAFVAGCSAAGLPSSEPEHVEPLSTTVPQSELEAIAASIRDVVGVAVQSLLRAPPGAVTKQLMAAGAMTIEGTAEQPSDTAETLTLAVAYDAYMPKVSAAVAYTDWRLSSASPPQLTISFTEEPPPNSDQLGFIAGKFAGTLAVSRGKNASSSDDVDARLTVVGQLKEDASGKVTWQVLHVSGVIYSPAFDYYYNDASFPQP
ncbi:MAG: hypothetical protein ACXWHC_18710 [Usitatibacter sp.]